MILVTSASSCFTVNSRSSTLLLQLFVLRIDRVSVCLLVNLADSLTVCLVYGVLGVYLAVSLALGQVVVYKYRTGPPFPR